MVCPTFADNRYTLSGHTGVACSTGSPVCPEGDSVLQPPLPTFESYFPPPPLEYIRSERVKSLLGLLPVRNLRQPSVAVIVSPQQTANSVSRHHIRGQV